MKVAGHLKFCFEGQRTIHEVTRSVHETRDFFVQFRVTSWILLFVLSF